MFIRISNNSGTQFLFKINFTYGRCRHLQYFGYAGKFGKGIKLRKKDFRFSEIHREFETSACIINSLNMLLPVAWE